MRVWGLCPLDGAPQAPWVGSGRSGGLGWSQSCCPRFAAPLRSGFTLDMHILSPEDLCPLRSWACDFSLPP